MSNIELIISLYKTAETDKQKEAINNVCKAFHNAPFSVVKYFSELDFDEIDGKVSSRIYDEYCRWCSTNGFIAESKKAVGTYIKETYHMESVQLAINGQRQYVYRWIGYN